MRWLLLVFLFVVVSACDGGSDPLEGESQPAARETSSATPDPVKPASVGSCFDRGPGDYVESIERVEGPRSYRIHVPPAYDGRALLPLLLNFHGQGQSAAQQEAYSGLIPVSDANGFILVSPEGGLAQWNIVGVYAEDGIDDLAATGEILDRLESEFCIDPQRVFATGHSNGGQMAAQLGCLLPNQIAGIAPVSGIEYQGCEEGHGVAVITFHGTDDYNVPYEPIPEIVASWASHNGCPETPETERIGASIVRDSYFGCSGAPVVFYTVEGGGHTWPGATSEGGVGPTNREINASELIWQFFKNVRNPN